MTDQKDLVLSIIDALKNSIGLNDDKILPRQDDVKDEKNNNVKTIKRVKTSKFAKDEWGYINSEKEIIGSFYGMNPKLVGKKIAKMVFRNTGKNDFEIRIYNKMRDKIYSFRVLVKEIDEEKEINGVIIPILHEIILIRI